MENRDFLLFDNNSLWKRQNMRFAFKFPPSGGARLPVCKRQARRAPLEEGFSQRLTPPCEVNT
jgi:hypothetical protein